MHANVSLRFGAIQKKKNPFGPIHKISQWTYEKIELKYCSVSQYESRYVLKTQYI